MQETFSAFIAVSIFWPNFRIRFAGFAQLEMQTGDDLGEREELLQRADKFEDNPLGWQLG